MEEEHPVVGLKPIGDDHRLDSADLDDGGRPHDGLDTPHHRPLEDETAFRRNFGHRSGHLEGRRHAGIELTAERHGKRGAHSRLHRGTRDLGVRYHREGGVLQPRFHHRPQQRRTVAVAAAARVVAEIRQHDRLVPGTGGLEAPDRHVGREILDRLFFLRLPTEGDQVGDDGPRPLAVAGVRDCHRRTRLLDVRPGKPSVYRYDLDALLVFVLTRLRKRLGHWAVLGRAAMIEAVQLIEAANQSLVTLHLARELPGQ